MQFIGKSLLYSVSVSLRMIPILAITAYGALMLLNVLADYPWLALGVCALVYMPLLAFLYLMAMRCGLTAMQETKPPLSKNYLPATIRFLRFPGMITNLLVTVFGVGGSFAFLNVFAPDRLAELQRVLFQGKNVPIDETIYAIADLPMAVLLLLAFSFSLGVSLTGANAGATANWVGERDGSPDMIWGVTRQWHHLLTFALLAFIAPFVALIFWLGGPLAPIWQFTTLTAPAGVAVGGALMWSICAMSAAQALAFVMTRNENAVSELKEKVEMSGPVYADDEVRAIRLERMARGKMNPSDQPAE